MAAPDAPVVEPEVEEHEARPLATYSDYDTEEWAKHQRGGRGGGSVGSSDSDVEVYWGPSARVVQWTQARTQQWALLAVGVPELEAAKVNLDGAALVCFPLDPTTKLEERLLAARVEEGATRAIAAAYQAQQWTICTEVRAAFPPPSPIRPLPFGHACWCVSCAAFVAQVVRKWSEEHVYRWATDVLGLCHQDAQLLGTWCGVILANADAEDVPNGMSPPAAARLADVLASKNWGLS
jgi:hypothetical protein